ncbi:MAG: hypothetical protein V1856_01720 [Candidatus Liptonbacteria bacterium]
MSYHWTVEQVERFTRLARKVERAARKKDGSRFNPVLFLRKMEEAFLHTIPEPAGGRICVLSNVLVHEDEDWTQALEAAGPQTPLHDRIRRGSSLYPPSGRGDVYKDFLLLNWPGRPLSKFLDWGKANGLAGTIARDVFAVGREEPHLNRDIVMDPMWVYATELRTLTGFVDPCMVLVQWNKEERETNYRGAESFGFARDWCLFSRETNY